MSKRTKIVIALAAIALNAAATIGLHIFLYERFLQGWDRIVSTSSLIVYGWILLLLLISLRTKRHNPQS